MFVFGGALISQKDGSIQADGQVWYSSGLLQVWEKGIFQTTKAGTTEVAPWGQRFAAATAVASDKVFLFGGITIDDKNNLEFFSDLWTSVEPSSSWKEVKLSTRPKGISGRVGSFLYDTTFISGKKSALFAYGGGIRNQHNSDFTDDVVELLFDVSVDAYGGEIVATEATQLGRTMTSISVFHSKQFTTNNSYLLMTGGSAYNTEPWKDIDDKGQKLPVLSGTTNVDCSQDGVSWYRVGGLGVSVEWVGRAGHWTGWFQGKTLMIGGSSNGQDFNDVWALEPKSVVGLNVLWVALIAAGSTALVAIFVFCCWSR